MARDKIHYAIKRALEKDGWTITNDPLHISRDETNFYIDIAARKFVTAQRNEEKIAVEIKSFNYQSILEPFYCAIGKYIVYRKALMEIHSGRELFLGISRVTYFRLNEILIFNRIMKELGVKLVIVNTKTEKITAWEK